MHDEITVLQLLKGSLPLPSRFFGGSSIIEFLVSLNLCNTKYEIGEPREAQYAAQFL